MPIMGRYSKAYPIALLRDYPGWQERVENMRCEVIEREGQEVEVQRRLHEEAFVYLHENYVVTDSIYLDTHIIFDQVTDEWKQFCDQQLGFQVPAFAQQQPAPDPAKDP